MLGSVFVAVANARHAAGAPVQRRERAALADLGPLLADGLRTLGFAVDTLLLLMAPMTPHVCAELWDRRHGTHVHEQPWPQADPALVAEATVTMVVQVDGKVRDRIEVNSSIDDATAEELALASPKVRAILGDRHPAKVVARPPRLVNIVT